MEKRAKYDERSKLSYRMKVKFNIKYIYFKKYLKTHMLDNFAQYSAVILNVVSTPKLPTFFFSILLENMYFNFIPKVLDQKLWGLDAVTIVIPSVH